ncbi:MAG: extracellular solute-binding protein [Bacillota bacterium]
MKIRRVLCVAVLAAMLACATASQAANVKIRVAGFGGTDTAIVEELIARFVQPNLKGITVAYEPIPDAYDKWIVNALSAGTGPDLFYVDIFWAQGLFSSGAVEPLDPYFAKSNILQGKDILPALLNAFTYKGKV